MTEIGIGVVKERLSHDKDGGTWFVLLPDKFQSALQEAGRELMDKLAMDFPLVKLLYSRRYKYAMYSKLGSSEEKSRNQDVDAYRNAVEIYRHLSSMAVVLKTCLKTDSFVWTADQSNILDVLDWLKLHMMCCRIEWTVLPIQTKGTVSMNDSFQSCSRTELHDLSVMDELGPVEQMEDSSEDITEAGDSCDDAPAQEEPVNVCLSCGNKVDALKIEKDDKVRYVCPICGRSTDSKPEKEAVHDWNSRALFCLDSGTDTILVSTEDVKLVCRHRSLGRCRNQMNCRACVYLQELREVEYVGGD